MAYEPTAAAISQAAEICSSRTRAMTPHATAPMIATGVQMTIERARDLVLTTASPDGCGGGWIPAAQGCQTFAVASPPG